MTKKKMLNKKSWDSFYKTGLLWWVNRQLHLFGWAIVIEVDDDGKITNTYPAKCKFRGFDYKTEESNFKKLTKHIKNNIKTILKDV